MSGATVHSPEIYDGPLDLLLSLIQKNKVSIYDIPIAGILDQYIDYIDRIRRENTEIASEFILMAAELLYLKSKMLLPREEEEEDPREDLVQTLLEYRMYQKASAFFALRRELYYDRFPSPPAKPIITKVTPRYQAAELHELMVCLRALRKEHREEDKKNAIERLIRRPVVSVEGKIVYVLRKLVQYLRFDRPVYFRELFSRSQGRSDKVACFLALLELVKSGRIKIGRSGNDYQVALSKKEKERKENEVLGSISGI